MPLFIGLMPTYNRFRRDPETGEMKSRLLEESIESFIRQDYQHKLLLILSDTPGQVVSVNQKVSDQRPVCPIHVLSYDKRFPSLGDKCNKGLEIARQAIPEGRVLVSRWDDDDISLPNRISTMVERIGDHPLMTVGGWFYEPRQDELIADIGPIGFGQDVVDLDLALQVKYAATGKPDEDQRFRKALIEAASSYRVFHPNVDELCYIYRWGATGQTHFSGRSDDGAFANFEAGEIIPGDFVVEPRWYRDYVAYADECRARYKQEKQNADLGNNQSES